MGGNKAGAAERSQALLSKGQPDEDLFPHLDTLVPSNLSALGVAGEALRILTQHYRAFLLPVSLLALWSLYGFWLSFHIPRWGGGTLAGWDHPSEWFWAYNLFYIVFSGLLEAAFHRTVVRVYLRENYGEDHGHDREDGKDFIFAGLRSIASVFANLIAFTVLSFAIGGLEFLVFSILDGSAWLQYEPVNLVLLVSAIVFYLVVHSVFFSLFVVSLPVSGLTRVYGFQALHESSVLTLGDRLASFGLYLTVFVLSFVATIPVVLPAVQHSREVSTVLLAFTSFWLWLLAVVWYPIRTVLYLKFRAWDKIHDGSRVLAA